MIKDIYLENLLTEDGHEDVPSVIRKLKTSIEDCQEIIQKLESVGDIELPTWWMGKVIESSDRLNKARDYILNSELTEGKNLLIHHHNFLLVQRKAFKSL